MNKFILHTVSALALCMAVPAYAETTAKTNASAEAHVDAENNTMENAGENLQEGWNTAKEKASEASREIADATQDAYNEIKAAFINGEENGEFTPLNIDERQTASGIIGQEIYNQAEEAVGTIHDIILDADGNASLVIVANGEYFGLGKKVAFDYASIMAGETADGRVMAPLSEEMLENAAGFTYAPEENENGDMQVMPANGYSVLALLDAQLIDGDGEAAADIDNISFENGHAEHLIVGFDKILGLGGHEAAITFDEVTALRNGDEIDFRLNSGQAAQFETYKKTFQN